MAATSTTTLADDVSLYIRDELLEIAEKNVVFAQPRISRGRRFLLA